MFQNKILTAKQLAVLDCVGTDKFISKNFYLTGGTALAGFYLQHRYSEDLDFFSENEGDPTKINVFLKSKSRQLGFKKIDFQQSYNRNLFFLHFDKEILKTEFTFFPFKRIEGDLHYNGLRIDSILDIAVNKLFTIYQRSVARDYIDLYFICQEKNFNMRELIKNAKIKFDWHIDPLQLGTQFIKAKEVKDFPRMIERVSNTAWQDFFIAEAKKLKSEILK